jgi:hypothetical protein
MILTRTPLDELVPTDGLQRSVWRKGNAVPRLPFIAHVAPLSFHDLQRAKSSGDWQGKGIL